MPWPRPKAPGRSGTHASPARARQLPGVARPPANQPHPKPRAARHPPPGEGGRHRNGVSALPMHAPDLVDLEIASVVRRRALTRAISSSPSTCKANAELAMPGTRWTWRRCSTAATRKGRLTSTAPDEECERSECEAKPCTDRAADDHGLGRESVRIGDLRT